MRKILILSSGGRGSKDNTDSFSRRKRRKGKYCSFLHEEEEIRKINVLLNSGGTSGNDKSASYFLRNKW